jgi:hypothetical protein
LLFVYQHASDLSQTLVKYASRLLNASFMADPAAYKLLDTGTVHEAV